MAVVIIEMAGMIMIDARARNVTYFVQLISEYAAFGWGRRDGGRGATGW
jgi:hypothetical protein